MKKFLVFLAISILAISIMPVSFADNEGIINAPPANLNIKVLDDLSNFAGVNDDTVKEWNNEPIEVEHIDENGNKLISITKTSGNFSIVQFANNSVGAVDYVAANGGSRPFGIAMYVRTTDYDVEIWTSRISDAEDSWANYLYLYDMNGKLYSSSADEEAHDPQGVVIPFEFEGYIVFTFPDTMSYSEANQLSWWHYSEPDGVLYIDNIGIVASEPTEASDPEPSDEPSSDPTADTTATNAEQSTTPPAAPSPSPLPSAEQQPEKTAEVTASAEQLQADPQNNDWIIWTAVGVLAVGIAVAAFIIISRKKRSKA